MTIAKEYIAYKGDRPLGTGTVKNVSFPIYKDTRDRYLDFKKEKKPNTRRGT